MIFCASLSSVAGNGRARVRACRKTPHRFVIPQHSIPHRGSNAEESASAFPRHPGPGSPFIARSLRDEWEYALKTRSIPAWGNAPGPGPIPLVIPQSRSAGRRNLLLLSLCHPERSGGPAQRAAAQSKDPDALHATTAGRTVPTRLPSSRAKRAASADRGVEGPPHLPLPLR